MLTDFVNKAIPVLNKFGVSKVILFGSVVDETAKKSSDIDILAIPVLNRKFWELKHELEETLDFTVDLYTQDDDSA